MKQTSIKTLYRLFAYLSDRTNGFKPFVHYKLMLGALLISLTANACKGKPTPTVPVADPEPEVTMALNQDTLIVSEDSTISEKVKFTPPVIITDMVTEEESPFIVHCYMPIAPELEINSEGDTIYYFVDEIASFPGGNEAMIQFIKENYHYPDVESYIDVSGKVSVSFVVKASGEIDNIEVNRKEYSLEHTNEAIRVVKLMPCWIPGIKNGEAVNTFHSILMNVKKDETNRH